MAKRVAAHLRALDLERELDRLEAGLRRELDRLPAELRPLEAALPALLGKAGAGERWVDRFAPLTLLYPLLHAEALGGGHRRKARSLVLPQALLVLHAFLDDRRRDRQVEWSDGHDALDAWLVERSLARLARSLGDGAKRRARELLADYDAAQQLRAASAEELTELVVRRHLVGFVTTECLLDAVAAPPSLVEAARAAFRGVALGLQWMDDLEDLEQDLASGGENLLLAAIPSAEPGSSFAHVLGELERARGLDAALAASHECFSVAGEVVGAADLPQLAGLLLERAERAAALRRVAEVARSEALRDLHRSAGSRVATLADVPEDRPPQTV